VLGLEQLGDPSTVRSVASFFVSRVDSEVDSLPQAKDLHGLAALSQARSAYGIFLQSFSEHAERWSWLASRGARPQRALWASTSTKDPSYDDLMYVNGLLARDSVNTLPSSTVDAILDHAKFDERGALSSEEIEAAHEDLATLKKLGIDMVAVAKKLELDGVEKFQKAFASMLAAI
jgi:transaldolase